MKKVVQGFTLIELLIVVMIIAVLAVSVFVALNPAQRLKDAKDARRSSDVQTIITAIHASIVDNKGLYPTNLGLNTPETQLGTAASGCATATGGCNVSTAACVDLMNAGSARNLTKYLKSMPIDPSGGTAYDATHTGYSVAVDANGIVTVRACGTEGTTNILVSE